MINTRSGLLYILMYTHIYFIYTTVKEIANNNLLYSTGNFSQYSVKSYMGKEFKKRLCVYAQVQLYLTPCDPMDCSPPGSSVHGILQARILEWVAMPSSTGSSRPRDQTRVSYVSFTARQILYCWTIRANNSLSAGIHQREECRVSPPSSPTPEGQYWAHYRSPGKGSGHPAVWVEVMILMRGQSGSRKLAAILFTAILASF